MTKNNSVQSSACMSGGDHYQRARKIFPCLLASCSNPNLVMALKLINTFCMYLKMMLAGQVLEQRPIQNASLYRGDFLQTTMREMIDAHEEEIETCDEQPQFILEERPTQLPSQKKAQLVLSKLGLFSKFFNWILP